MKVDPDAVFMANRLKERLHRLADYLGPVYIKNCDRNEPPGFGMYGPIEVISTAAVKKYLGKDGIEHCRKTMKPDRENMGEDYFLQKCLDKLDVRPIKDFHILKDAQCLGRKIGPCTTGQVAFHPFKDSNGYLRCLNEARRLKGINESNMYD